MERMLLEKHIFQFPLLGSSTWKGKHTTLGNKLSIPFIGFNNVTGFIVRVCRASFNSLYWVHWNKNEGYRWNRIRSFNSLYWVPCCGNVWFIEKASDLSIPFIGFNFANLWASSSFLNSFNSLYWVPVTETKISGLLVRLSIPFIGFMAATMNAFAKSINSFNSLYWVRNLKNIHIHKRIHLSIPFIGFKSKEYHTQTGL